MSLSRCLQQCIKNAASDTIVRIGMYSYSGGNLVGNPKSHTGNVLRQLIRIFFHNTVEAHAVLVIDLNRQRVGDSVSLQKDKSLPHVLFFSHLICNLSGLSLTDALNFGKSLRFLLQNTKGIFFKLLYNSGGKGLSDSLNCSRTEVSLHTQHIIRCYNLEAFRLKLSAVKRMLHIFAAQFQRFAAFHGPKCTYTNQFIFIRHK